MTGVTARLAAVALCAAAWLMPHGADAQPAPAPQDVAPAAPRAMSPADSAALEARVAALASQLRCPVCQGESIQDSPSPLAQEMRAVVREQLAAGRTPDEVKAYFVSKYGEWILLQPRARGINLLVYAAPWVVLLGGGALIALAVRRWTRRDDPAPRAQGTSLGP